MMTGTQTEFPSGALLLEQYRELFKDEGSYKTFLSAFKQATEKGLGIVLSDGDLIGAVLSPGCTKKVLTDRIVQSVAKNPQILEDLEERLQEEIVDRMPEK